LSSERGQILATLEDALLRYGNRMRWAIELPLTPDFKNQLKNEEWCLLMFGVRNTSPK
jgi:hypothetical protein